MQRTMVMDVMNLYIVMPRPQSILVLIASMANTRMSLSHSRHLQCTTTTTTTTTIYLHRFVQKKLQIELNEYISDWAPEITMGK